MTEKQLADQIKAMGVPLMNDGYRYKFEWEPWGHSVALRELTDDWRVAGALMEKCEDVEFTKLENGEWEASIYANERGLAFNESLPRALIEASTLALVTDGQTPNL